MTAYFLIDLVEVHELLTPQSSFLLLRAWQELCRLHGADLPDDILAKFGARMKASRRASKEAKGEPETEFDQVEEFRQVPAVPTTTPQVLELQDGAD